jgi:hypothetical protein
MRAIRPARLEPKARRVVKATSAVNRLVARLSESETDAMPTTTGLASSTAYIHGRKGKPDRDSAQPRNPELANDNNSWATSSVNGRGGVNH